MREAVGGGFLFNLVIFIVGMLLLFFVGGLAFSKAFKAKNTIIEYIEDGSFTTRVQYQNSNEKKEIDQALKTMGYQTNLGLNPCKNISGHTTIYNGTGGYKYCIYMKEDNRNPDGTPTYHYKVVTYMRFDLPLVGQYLQFPVHGETKVLGKNYDY